MEYNLSMEPKTLDIIANLIAVVLWTFGAFGYGYTLGAAHTVAAQGKGVGDE